MQITYGDRLMLLHEMDMLIKLKVVNIQLKLNIHSCLQIGNLKSHEACLSFFPRNRIKPFFSRKHCK